MENGGNEGRLRDEREKGHQVKHFLDNEHFVEAVEATRDALWGEFVKTKPEDTDTLQRIAMQHALLNHLVKALRKHVETGEMAAQELLRGEQNPGQPWPATWRSE
jgi:hypothetical protein